MDVMTDYIPDIRPVTPGRTRTLLMAIRQALIMCLGAIEDYLQMRRSIVPKGKRG